MFEELPGTISRFLSGWEWGKMIYQNPSILGCLYFRNFQFLKTRIMKKEEIPQDDGALNKLTKEVVYAIDNTGKYTTELSTGWDVKINALDVAWKDIEERVAAAKQKVLNKEASPILYFMELRLMDIPIVAAYTGFWKWTIKQHIKPTVFDKLPERKLQQYASAFNVSIADLKTMTVHED